MKNKISHNYLLNRYSYLYFIPFVLVAVRNFQTSHVILLHNEIIPFCIYIFFYLLWIFYYGSFHFFQQVYVERLSQNSLQIKKGFSKKVLVSNDIKKIYIHRLINHKTGNMIYKVLMIDYYNEQYRFSFVPELQKRDDLFESIDDFWESSECCWGLVDKDCLSYSSNFLKCN